MATKVESKEADYDPLCPHCEKKIDEVNWRRIKGLVKWEYLFICPSCKKVIGVAATD
jgi:hypothetical protein